MHYLWGKFVFAIFYIFENPIDWVTFKQIIAAPIFEEFMFRGIIFGLYRDCGIFKTHSTLCLTLLPLYFATAHTHILW